MGNDKWKMLPVISDRFNRATTHRFLTQRFFFFTLRLFVDKRVVVFVAPHEVVRRGVAANVAIDAGRVYVESTADVFLYFVVSIGHCSLYFVPFGARFFAFCGSRMRHLFGVDLSVKLFPGQIPELDG